MSDIDRWHRARGWSGGCGYHYFIKLDGTLQVGRDIAKIGAHTKNHNTNTIGVCFEGGLKEDMKTPWEKPTDRQLVTWKRLLNYLKEHLKIDKVSAHYEYSSKTCPNFHVNILK